VSATVGVEQKSPILTPGVANLASVAGSCEVAGGHQLAAGGGCDTVYLGDHRAGRGESPPSFGADVEQPLVEGDVASDHLAEVVPGREERAGALDHDRAYVRDLIRADASAESTSPISLSESALRFSGRLSVSRAADPCRETRMVWKSVVIAATAS
jgi:hypothetical protein